MNSLQLSHQVNVESGSDDIQYIFTEDDPSHTSILDSKTCKTIYTAVTEYPGYDVITNVRNSSGDIIGSLEWKDTKPDRVKYKDNKAKGINHWLKAKSLLNPVSKLEFKDEAGRKYYWQKTYKIHLTISQLYYENRPKIPIAKFQRSLESSPAKLIMTPRAYEISDLCVTSFLFQEKNRRRKGRGAMSKTDVLAKLPGNVPVQFGGWSSG
ncbi:hypothetical protein M422DRAFT_185846 [Sphaerobolus stellatus SS14]|uniref:DUF6593 domain-containing protein n=1 Tax=Sphaerobolus stellatus (strain SS14) TaxID=990650 RepID=A0A0C9TN81_SPHS4|nr:hypothetical protein M422DRAFT_185846 [Sphaerobolus stellatus SS14]